MCSNVLNYIRDMFSEQQHCVKEVDKYAVVVSTLDCIIALIAICGNSLIIFVVRKFRHLQTPTNMFVVAIAATDILTGLTIPYYVSFYFDVPYKCQKYPCLIRYFFTLFSTLWSLLLMIGLAVDRYIAVLKPLHYASMVQKRRVGISIIVSAMYMAIICLLPFFIKYDPGEYMECDLYYIESFWHAMLAVCFHVAITIVITSLLYWQIYREALRHQRNAPTAFHKKWETNMTIMMMLILGVHLIALMPYLIVVMMRYYFEDEIQSTFSDIKKFTTVLYFAKSIANPFICALRNKGFRLAFRRCLGFGRTVPKNDFSFHLSNAPPRLPNSNLF